MPGDRLSRPLAVTISKLIPPHSRRKPSPACGRPVPGGRDADALRAEFTQSADAALAMFAASIRDQRTNFPNDTDPSHDKFRQPYIDVLKEARLAPEKVAALDRDYKKNIG